MDTDHNSQEKTQPIKILALSPSRRAIGAALVDGVGVVKIWLLRFGQVKDETVIVLKARKWLSDIFLVEKPTATVLEKLKAKRSTGVNLVLLGMLQATAGRFSCEHVCQLDPAGALMSIRERIIQETGEKKSPRATLRQVAEWLSHEVPEFALHRPKQKAVVSRDWERSWGLVVKATAMALYARDSRFKTCIDLYAPSTTPPAATSPAQSSGGEEGPEENPTGGPGPLGGSVCR